MNAPSFDKLKASLGISKLDLDSLERMHREARNYQLVDPNGATPLLNEIARQIADMRHQRIQPTPAVAAGYTRFYHGGPTLLPDETLGRHITPSLAYAEGYARKEEWGFGGEGSRFVHYIDLPESHPQLKKAFEDEGTSMKAPYVSFELSAAEAKGLRPYHGKTSDEIRQEVAAMSAQLSESPAGAAPSSDVTGGTGGGDVTSMIADQPVPAATEATPTSDIAAALTGSIEPEGGLSKSGAAAPPTGDISTTLQDVLPADEPAAKKKRQETNWGGLLHQIGGHLGTLGHAMGSHRIARAGSAIQGAGAMVKMANLLSAHFGQSDEATGGAAGQGPADTPPENVANILGSGQADVPPEEATGSGIGGITDTMNTIEHGGGAGGDRQAQEGGSELHSAITELIEAVKKLTEELQQQHKKPGKDGDHMPDGGSFGGGGGLGGAMGSIGEALGLSPGEIQLIVTMIRTAMIVAA